MAASHLALAPSAYLLIAQPKSSSSSLVSSLASMANLIGRQVLSGVCHHPVPHGTLTHGDFCGVRRELACSWLSQTEKLYKQHLPPTHHNVNAIFGCGNGTSKVLVLVRNPWASTESECEGARGHRGWGWRGEGPMLAANLQVFRNYSAG